VKEMEVQKVSRYVGWDGEHYFCLGCYQADFDSPSQVNGHQRVCPVRQPKLVASAGDIGTVTLDGGAGGGGKVVLPKQEMKYQDTSSDMMLRILNIQLAPIKQELADVKKAVYNELPHKRGISQMGFLGIANNTWVWIIGIGIGFFLVYKLGQESKCHCDINAGSSRRRLGSTLQDKVTDKAVSYGISRLFNKIL